MMQMQHRWANQAPAISQQLWCFPGLGRSLHFFLQSQHFPLDTPPGFVKMTEEKLAAGRWSTRRSPIDESHSALRLGASSGNPGVAHFRFATAV